MRFLLNIWNNLRRLVGLHDSEGHKYSPRYLDKLKYSIAFEPLSVQAQFADLLTVKNITNEQFILLTYSGLLDAEEFKKLCEKNKVNAVHIGNLAFIALNANRKSLRVQCVNILDDYKKFAKQKIAQTDYGKKNRQNY